MYLCEGYQIHKKCNLPGLRRHLEHDGVHDEGHKLWHHIVNVQLIQLQKQTRTTSVPKELTQFTYIELQIIGFIQLIMIHQFTFKKRSVEKSGKKKCLVLYVLNVLKERVLSKLNKYSIYLIHQDNYDGQLCKHLQR